MIRASLIAALALLMAQAYPNADAVGATSLASKTAPIGAQVRYVEPDIPHEAHIHPPRMRAPMIGAELFSLLCAAVFPPLALSLEDGAHFLPVMTADIAPDRSSRLRLVSYNDIPSVEIGNERPWTAQGPRKDYALAA